MKRIICAAALLALAGCNDPNRFNLQCHTVMHFTTLPEKANNTVMRVDLTAKKWCAADCTELKDLKVTENLLIFAESDQTSNIQGQMLLRSKYFAQLDRATGKYLFKMFTHIGPGDIIESEDGGTSEDGTCAKAPFTGFPKKKF